MAAIFNINHEHSAIVTAITVVIYSSVLYSIAILTFHNDVLTEDDEGDIKVLLVNYMYQVIK